MSKKRTISTSYVQSSVAHADVFTSCHQTAGPPGVYLLTRHTQGEKPIMCGLVVMKWTFPEWKEYMLPEKKTGCAKWHFWIWFQRSKSNKDVRGRRFFCCCFVSIVVRSKMMLGRERFCRVLGGDIIFTGTWCDLIWVYYAEGKAILDEGCNRCACFVNLRVRGRRFLCWHGQTVVQAAQICWYCIKRPGSELWKACRRKTGSQSEGTDQVGWSSIDVPLRSLCEVPLGKST